MSRRAPTRLWIFLPSAPGLEGMLAEEVRERSLGHPRVVVGGVELRGNLRTIYRANVELGLARSVRLRLGWFRARTFGALEEGIRRLELAPWLPAEGALRIDVTARRSRLHHTGAIDESVRRALGEALSRVPDAPPVPGHRWDGITLKLRAEEDRFVVSVDTSGLPLSKRGYRKEGTKAPLREDLALALVRVSGWSPEQPFVDPFCGSGTLSIEAARRARGIASGLDRDFAIRTLPVHREEILEEVRWHARRQVRPLPGPVIWGSDRDAGAIAAARRNAERAGVGAEVRFLEAPLSECPLPEDRGPVFLVTHPPHGKRVGDARRLRSLYQVLGARFASLPSGSGLAFVGADQRLSRSVGVPLRTAALTDQGGMKVRLHVSSGLENSSRAAHEDEVQ